jgi:Ca2+:H+ antiporter
LSGAESAAAFPAAQEGKRILEKRGCEHAILRRLSAGNELKLAYLGYVLLLASVGAPIAFWFGAPPVVLFLLAGLGIIPFAALLGRATDSLAAHVGARLSGLLNATFGNATELIIAILALRQGLLSVVKASITGSIIGNVLFVVGLSVLAGGLRNGRQQFNQSDIRYKSTLLVLASIGLAIPSVLYHTLGPSVDVRLSQEVAAVLLVTYVINLVHTLCAKAERATLDSASGEEPPEWGSKAAAGVLFGSTAAVAVLSELLVDALSHLRDAGFLATWGMSDVFVGVIIVAVIGNAAEHSAAVQMAYKNRMDLALQISLGSSLQIALLVSPILVFASVFVAPAPLDLHFTLLEVLAVWSSAIVIALVAADGHTQWIEGVLLLAVYMIIALAFYHMPRMN